MLDELRLVLEQEDRGTADRADVDRLVGGIQDEHTATITSAPPVLRMRREPLWAWWRGLLLHDLASSLNGVSTGLRQDMNPAPGRARSGRADRPPRRLRAPRAHRPRSRRRTGSGRAGRASGATRSS